MSYNEFLINLSKLTPSSACWNCEVNSAKYGKSVRQVSEDFKKMFGVSLGA